MATTTDDLEATQLRIATQCQQNYYENFRDWYHFESNEPHCLKSFIGCVLFGPPNYKEPKDGDRGEGAHFSYDPEQCEAINLVFDKAIEYGNSDIVLCGLVYNVIYNKEQSLNVNSIYSMGYNYKVGEMKAIEPVAQVYPVPVFKVRSYQSAEMKTYYIDNVGRVYDGFLDYLQNNTLPQCTMVVPKDGRYQADPVSSNVDNFVGEVWIDVHQSPAGNLASKVLLGGDIASTVVTLASLGVGIAAMVTPIGAGIAAASAFGAGVSGLWSVGRGAQKLADRGQHGESINVTDRAALGAWIEVAGGSLGIAATGGTMLLTRAVRTVTTIGSAAKVAHGAVLIGNLIVNGVGVDHQSSEKGSDFGKILFDVRDAKIATEIFFKLLDIAVEIYRAPRPSEQTIGNILSTIVQFLWDHIKRNLPGIRFDCPLAQKQLDELIAELSALVAKRADILIEDFREWLKKEFPYTIDVFRF